jgi:arsenate reductase-like glutaredoxin family protein
MAPKRATFFSYGSDEKTNETRKYIEGAGVILDVRDISKNPLTEDELAALIGFRDIRHFLNNLSESYTKHNLDQRPMARKDIIKLMAADYTLIRRPIIRTTRLLTVGCDRKKISEMLQISDNGSQPNVDDNRRSKNRMAAKESSVSTGK